MNPNYKNAYGTWSVSTEGDVEGKTTNNLGVFTGYVDEIAFHLADKCYYALRFKKVEAIKDFTFKGYDVNISFDVESETWDFFTKTTEGLNELSEVFKNRPVSVRSSNYYACFRIVSNRKDDIKKQAALSKLTNEERKLLGL